MSPCIIALGRIHILKSRKQKSSSQSEFALVGKKQKAEIVDYQREF